MCPICPKCKEIIEYLSYSSCNYRGGTISIDEKGFEEYEEDGNLDLINQDITFNCPECNEELFTDDDEAISFLKEVDELQELVVEKINKTKEKNDMPKV